MPNLFDLDRWEEILQTILRNKTRSLLTAFGIFWGIFMLVFLMGSGEGMKRMMAKNFDGFAQNSCFVFASPTSKAYKGFQVGRTWELHTSDVELLRRRVSNLETVTPMLGRWGQTFAYREKTSSGTLKGVAREYADIEAPHISMGRFFNGSDLRDFRKVCVIGKRVCEELFPDIDNPCGQFIEVDGIHYQVIGVSKMGSAVGVMGSAERSVMIPFTTMQRVYNYGNAVQTVCMTAKRGTTVSEIIPQVEFLLRSRHAIAPDDLQALQVVNLEAMFQMVDSLFRGIGILVWLIGLGTLLSGVIGVSNIMMVTVRERTTEIGIRRAIGARPSSILSQIMAESIVLTTLAGLSGITFAVLLLQGLEAAASQTDIAAGFQISFGMAVGSAAALAALGTIAGIAPSFRALAIRPIDAIRDE